MIPVLTDSLSDGPFVPSRARYSAPTPHAPPRWHRVDNVGWEGAGEGRPLEHLKGKEGFVRTPLFFRFPAPASQNRPQNDESL